MNLSAEVLDKNASGRQRQKGKHRKPRTDLQHERQRAGGKYDRVRRVHDRRPEQHAHSVQIVGRARHDVAGPRALIVRIRKRFQMLKEIVAQVEFDLTRNADQNPPHQKLKETFTERDHNQRKRVRDDLVAGDAPIQIVDRTADDLRKEYPDGVIQQKREPAPKELDAISVQIRL